MEDTPWMIEGIVFEKATKKIQHLQALKCSLASYAGCMRGKWARLNKADELKRMFLLEFSF